MPTILTNEPSRRGGAAPRKNQNAEFRARNMATDWSRRNMGLASREELEKTREALRKCGVVVSATYSAPARLLATIEAQLAARVS